MVVAYIEIERDKDWKGKGNINFIPKKEYWAILHGHGGGKLDRTVFMVNTDQSNIDKVANSHQDVKVYTSKQTMQIRGLEIKPGTMTDSEVDIFVNILNSKHNIDLNNIISPTAEKNWVDYLKQDTPSIGKGNVKCNNCGTINKEGILSCINCKQSLDNAEGHRNPFNIDQWK